VRVLITGATGLVGRELVVGMLRTPGVSVRAAVRDAGARLPAGTEMHVVGELGASPGWARALHACDALVHLAARVHVMRDTAPDAAREFEPVNVDATLQLANQAAAAGVRRFIFLSTVKVNGEHTLAGEALGPDAATNPADAYALSKLRAERGLRELARRSGLEVVVVRSPLIYGPGVKANFLRLLRWVDRGWLLPLAAIRNSRSLVSVWNLCDLLGTLLVAAHAGGETWMVSDGEDLSTPELVRRLAAAMQRRARLVPVPESALRASGALLGRAAEVARLCDSLVVDIGRTRDRLGWAPPLGVDEGLRRTVAWYLTAARA
jgi:UDP-4-keto-D-QuiNAc 4-reductase